MGYEVSHKMHKNHGWLKIEKVSYDQQHAFSIQKKVIHEVKNMVLLLLHMIRKTEKVFNDQQHAFSIKKIYTWN